MQLYQIIIKMIIIMNFLIYFCIVDENLPRDCRDILWAGKTESKVYTIYPLGDGEVEVYCDQDTYPGGWTVHCDIMGDGTTRTVDNSDRGQLGP
jgi:hypothetical protein